MEPELTKIQTQKVVSPASEFLRVANVPEVFKNVITLEFNAENISCPSNCDAVADYADGTQAGLNKSLEPFSCIILKNCDYPLIQNLELNLWSQSPDVNIVFGLEENSMRLYQDDQEAINANNIGPEEFKFCYVEVKLISTDEEQFANINYWDLTTSQESLY